MFPKNVRTILHYHDLTFSAHSCTAQQMEIFAQEFERVSYFCDWTCIHLITSRQKQGPISENKLFQKMKLSQNGFIISCSTNPILLKKKQN